MLPSVVATSQRNNYRIKLDWVFLKNEIILLMRVHRGGWREVSLNGRVAEFTVLVKKYGKAEAQRPQGLVFGLVLSRP